VSLVFALLVGTMAGCGVWLLLRARSFDMVLGLTLLGYAVNLLIFAMGRLKPAADPILQAGKAGTLAHYADPLTQALVLTAIVIGFAMTALLLALALRARAEGGSDHVDGTEPHARSEARP
jgi:multicomponent K+:H+ antiporter subunit C